jgi:hypothetical protein
MSFERMKVWRDPCVRRGPWRVLQRTDAMHAVVDERRSLGKWTVHTCVALAEALELCERLADLEGFPSTATAEQTRREHREGRVSPLDTKARAILGLDEYDPELPTR